MRKERIETLVEKCSGLESKSAKKLIKAIKNFLKLEVIADQEGEFRILHDDFEAYCEHNDIKAKKYIKHMKEEDSNHLVLHIFREWVDGGYYNDETIELDPIEEIPFDQRLLLDGYIISFTDVKGQAKSDLFQLYINPHTGFEYSESALTVLRQCEALECYTKALDEEISKKSPQVASYIVTALHELLLQYLTLGMKVGGSFCFRPEDLDICILEKWRFMNELFTFPKEDVESFMQTRVSIEMTHRGGSYNQAIADILVGDRLQCIIVEQVFLWAFLKQMRPETCIPEAVARHHDARSYQLPGHNRRQNSQRVRLKRLYYKNRNQPAPQLFRQRRKRPAVVSSDGQHHRERSGWPRSAMPY